MIIISAGLQKSGSTLIANYEEELLKKSGRRNGQDKVVEKLKGRYILKLDRKLTIRLIFYNLFYGSFLIKTHSKPDKFMRFLIDRGFAKATYSFRDPRDVLLSAIDHGNRSRAGEDPNMAFVGFETINQSIPKVIGLLGLWKRWMDFGKAYFIRYESIMENPLRELKKISDYLGLKVNDNVIMAIIDEQEKNKYQSHNFNKGTTNRFRTELNEEQLRICNQDFEEHLIMMGYDP